MTASTVFVVGIAWFQKEDWGRLEQLCPDRDEMYETYDFWMISLMAGLGSALPQA
jgi:hypothetical protein